MAEIRNAVLGGYNKDDVNSYIKKLKNSFHRRRQEYCDEITLLQRKADLMQKKLDEYESERAEMLEAAAESKNEIACLNGVIADLKEEADELNKALKSLKSAVPKADSADNILSISSAKKKSKIKLTLRSKKKVSEKIEEDFNEIVPMHGKKVKVSDIKEY